VTDQEQNRFEAELREIKAARLPEDFRSRLLAAAPPTKACPVRRPWPAPVALGWQRVRRFFIPAAVAAALTVVVWRHGSQMNKAARKVQNVSPAVATVPRADDVQIAQDLVSSFDTVATLPTGEPVRFQCQRWVDKVTFTDKSRGLVLEERRPRVEIVPVRFEIY